MPKHYGLGARQVDVLIATRDRNDLLMTRALPSVFAQSSRPSRIVLVDDSGDPANTAFLRRSLAGASIPIDIIENRRTRGASGAWNSGLDHLARVHLQPHLLHVALLDDDDEWNPDHLAEVEPLLAIGIEIVAAPFRRIESGIVRKIVQPPTTLLDRDFLVGNPGIQASNLIVRLDRMLEAGCFDESLMSCTDRDLCVRLARLGAVPYRRTDRATVDHYACVDRSRLSTPTSEQRHNGLSGFFTKYGPQMRPNEREAFLARGSSYFGWRPSQAEALESRALDASYLHEEDEDASLDSFHVVVGLIADPDRAVGLTDLFDDLVLVQQEQGVAGLDVVVLENGRTTTPDPRIAALVERYRGRGLRLHFVDRAAWSEATAAGEVAAPVATSRSRSGISCARTALQTYLYHFAKSRRGSVLWILDDDMRLDPLVQTSHGPSRQRVPIVPHLRRIRAAGLDVAIGRYTGAAPLPAVSTVRVQLVDLLWNLRRLTTGDGGKCDAVAHNTALSTGRRDYYYDLSRIETDRLETPFCLCPISPEETATRSVRRLLALAPRILAGEQVFRPLVHDPATFDGYVVDDSLDRGGNTFVFDVNALADVPNLVPEVDGRPTRRSDMIWALLQRTNHGRRVGCVPMATYHDRALMVVPDRLDVEAIVDDVRGYAVSSALRDQRSCRDIDVGECARKYEEERLAALRLSFYRIRGLAGELEAWASGEAPAWASPSAWSRFAGAVREMFSVEVFDRIAQSVLRLEPEQVRHFVAGLPDCQEAHRVRMRRHEVIETQLAAQRTKNALAAVAPIAPLGAQLQLLGSGSEGVALTDGNLVYKVFDYWEAHDVQRACGLLASLVGKWIATRALYPLRAFERRRGGCILVYPFEPSEPYRGGWGPGIVDLLVECHRYGIVCRNIHPKNLRVVDGAVRLIDYGSDLRLLDDPQACSEEFVAMCRRAFLSWRWAHREDLAELMRRSLSERALPELEGFDRFLHAVRQTLGLSAPEDPVGVRARELDPCSVLDYGAGKGKLAVELATFAERVVAYDPDPTVADRLRGLAAAGVEFVPSPAAAINSGPFELVVCRRVACILDDGELSEVLRDLRSAVSSEGHVLLALCHPVYAPRCATPEAAPTTVEQHDWEGTFVWHKVVRSTGRTLREVYRPEHRLHRLVQRAGFAVVGRRARETVDLQRFEPIGDVLMLELRPTTPPDVTLVVKACALEAETLDIQIRHLVASLERPRGFAEIVLALDDRVDGFLRQHGRPDAAGVKFVATRLMEQGWIDRIVEAPGDEASLTRLNQRWFGVTSSSTHAANGAQLAVLLSAFEACRTPFALHADVDVMIGRADTEHDYLADMLHVLRGNDGAVTVAFNIANQGDVAYTSEREGLPWRTESRIGLVDLDRLRRLLPLPNAIASGMPKLPWHRALDRAIAGSAGGSWRGGDRRTSFIHPPNRLKGDRDTWFSILDRVEQGKVPALQRGRVDLLEHNSAWIPAERFEPFVFVIAGRNVAPERFRRCLDSVLRQQRRDWGAVVIDDASMPIWAAEIEALCRPHRDRITLVRRRRRVGLLANTVDAVRHRCGDPQTIMVTLDADDCLIGDAVLDRLHALYADGADVTIGSMLRTDKHRAYPVDFLEPRMRRGGNVWQHLRTFRKALFDAVPDEYMRADGRYIDQANDWAYMLPIVELAKSPRYVEDYLYLHEPSGKRTAEAKRAREAIIADVTARPPLRVHVRRAELAS